MSFGFSAVAAASSSTPETASVASGAREGAVAPPSACATKSRSQ